LVPLVQQTKSNHRAISVETAVNYLIISSLKRHRAVGAADVMAFVNPLTRPVLQDVDANRRGFELAERLADQHARAMFAARRNSRRETG
jgi:hypothetical protein